MRNSCHWCGNYYYEHTQKELIECNRQLAEADQADREMNWDD